MNSTDTPTAMDLMVKTALKSWTLHVQRVNDTLDAIGDEGLEKEIAPGRNRGLYVLGHLVAVNDGILPLLGFGEKLYPHLEALFVTHPDSNDAVFPPLTELKKYWHDVNAKLLQHFERLEPEEWLTRHNAVSAADFEKEPYRNKLNILIGRSHHIAYHYGQLALLKPRKKI